MEKYDLVVIGGGPGGYPAAIRGAQRGAAVALVEKEALGGTCLNWGCIPTKTLIAAATHYDALRQAERFGLRTDHVAFDYAAMIQNKNQVVQKLRGGIVQLLKAHGVTVYTGTAAFAGRNRIKVCQADKSETILETAHTIIASGSCSVMPGFLPKAPAIMDSRAFLDLTQLPRRLLVMGGGVIGCEMACMAAQFGVAVTVVEMLEDILMPLDADMRVEARRRLEKDLHITVLTGGPLENVKAGQQGLRGECRGQTVEADLLLVAVGRQPVTGDLQADQVGLTPNARGYFDVDAWGQTRATTVYAVGDVTGGPQLAHAATAQGLTAVEHALGQRRRPRSAVIPNCIFTSPEIATAGLSEQEAAQQKRAVTIGKYPFAALGKALAAGEPAGFVKWIVDTETDQLLGAQVIGAHATELIAAATIAIQAELTAAELAATIHAHPTMAEAWMEAAHAVHGECIHAPPRKTRKK